MNESNPQIPDELLSAYLDGELSASEQASVEARLAVDAAARAMVEELKAVSQAVSELPRQGADASLQSAVLRRVEKTRGKIQKRAQASPRQTADIEYTVGRSKRGWIWAAATIAAALFVMAYQGQFGPESQFGDVAQRSDPSHSSQPESESKPVPGLAPELVNAPAPAAQGGGGGGGVGGAADFTIPEPMSEATPLVPSSGLVAEKSAERSKVWRGRTSSAKPIVVQLTMPMESRRNRVLENMLAGQQIVAEENEADIDESESLAAKESGGPENDYPEVEVISVEAPQQDVFFCLATIEKDTKNFLNVDVQELLQESFAVDSLEGAELIGRAKSASQTANQWQQFNRSGSVPRQQFSQPSTDVRRLQKRKSTLSDRSSSSADESWQQVYFVIGSEHPSAAPPAKKASAN